MLGPMEYNAITITLPVDYNTSIAYMYAYNKIAYIYVKYYSQTFSNQFG